MLAVSTTPITININWTYEDYAFTMLEISTPIVEVWNTRNCDITHYVIYDDAARTAFTDATITVDSSTLSGAIDFLIASKME